MKRFIEFSLVCLCLLVLVGCPAPPVTDDLAVDTTGGIKINLNLKTKPIEAAKALSVQANQVIGDSFKQQASMVRVVLDPVIGQKGGGSVSGQREFYFPVIGGVCQGEALGIASGNYWVRVYILDGRWFDLFEYHGQITIQPKQTTPLQCVMRFLDGYYFELIMRNLPGVYDPMANSEFSLTAYDGSYSWSNSWWLDEEGQTRMLVRLPLDFAGGILTFIDAQGEKHICDLPLVPANLDWNVFRFGDLFDFTYAEPSNAGNLDISMVFEYEQAVVANGQAFSSIQEAVDQLTPPINIILGEGVYDGAYLPCGVSITGQGADKTTIVSVPGMTNAIHFSAMGVYVDSDAISLQNLKVQASYADNTYPWCNAAIFVEAGDLYMRNCVVEVASMGSGIVTNYCGEVSIDHCIVKGNGGANGISTLNENEMLTVVKNTAIDGFANGAGCSNKALQVMYCNIFRCDTSLSGSPISGNIYSIDPAWLSGYQLPALSPLIGAGDDGQNIGLISN